MNRPLALALGIAAAASPVEPDIVSAGVTVPAKFEMVRGGA